MTGIILAGGKGTRLRPMTYITNKHLLPVYNKPMIDYPIQTLKDMGCDDILIISGGDHIGDFAEYLGNGSRYGLRFTYRVQPEAGGIAQALGMAEGFIDSHECFPVILGDNYFDKTPPMPNHPTIFVKEVDNPNRFGVLSGKTIAEKPIKPESNLAVTGLYIYNFKVFSQVKHLKRSARGELEITDINNWYLQNENTTVETYEGFWSDMGTLDSLLEVANYVKNTIT
jgi:glucose-1-phosphate thymidylyltransferase